MQDKQNSQTPEELAPEVNEELATLREELEAARAVAETANKFAAEMTANAQRLQADFENFRKRNVDSVSRARADGENGVMTDLLPALDVFDHALKMITDENVAVGVRMIQRKIMDTLASYGVEPIPSMGEVFNPEYHEAIEQVACEDEAMSGHVVEVLQQGYRRGAKVLRCSMVKVAQ
jgi:molecular chaperone GrpE